MKKLLKQIITAGLASVLFLVSVSSVHAAFPGQNGKLAYGFMNVDFENEIFSAGIADMNINGTGSRNLATTSWAGNFDSNTRAPRYSADGLRITYTHESGSYDLDIYTMNADGTDKRNVTNLDFEGNDRFAMYSSFHLDGTQLAYGELWYEDDLLYGDIFKINEDGTDRQQLTTSNPDECNMYPVFSPDGSRIAFYRGDRISDTGGIYVMDSDGTNLHEIIQITSAGACRPDNIMATISSDTSVSNFDWSPDGEKIVYINTSYDEETEEGIHSLRTVDLDGNYQVVYEKYFNVIFSTMESLSLGDVQFTPDGKILLKEMTVVADEGAADGIRTTASIQLVNTNGENIETITSKSGEGEFGVYEIVFGGLLLPTIQPLPNTPQPPTPNQITLANAGNGAAVLLTTPESTELTCSSSIAESAQSVQDAAYIYPLGLVDFCFDTESQNNEVSLTFVTHLKPHEVIARKYNSSNNTYFDIQGATITQTTYQNQPALQLTYTIEDNGILDLDPETGKVRDPVGLAVAEGSGGGELASTGVNQGFMVLVTSATISGAGWLLIRQMKNSIQI